MVAGRKIDPRYDADILAVDGNDNRILIGEIKSQPITRPDELLAFLRQRFVHAEFWMLADTDRIRFYRDDAARAGPLVPTLELDARPILREYDPDADKTRFFEQYLTTLFTAWLKDLAFEWKSKSPPGVTSVQRTGLLDRLRERDVLISQEA